MKLKELKKPGDGLELLFNGGKEPAGDERESLFSGVKGFLGKGMEAEDEEIEKIFSFMEERGAEGFYMERDRDSGDYIKKFKIDGLYHSINRIPSFMLEDIKIRLKTKAGVRAEESKISQTATLMREKGLFVVSFFPCQGGERIYIKPLPDIAGFSSLEELGLTSSQTRTVTGNFQSGLMIVGGLAESGKTVLAEKILEFFSQSSCSLIIEPLPGHERKNTVRKVLSEGETIMGLLSSSYHQDFKNILIDYPDLNISHILNPLLNTACRGKRVILTAFTGNRDEIIARLEESAESKTLLKQQLKIIIISGLERKTCGCERGCADCFYTGFKGRRGVYDCRCLKAGEERERRM